MDRSRSRATRGALPTRDRSQARRRTRGRPVDRERLLKPSARLASQSIEAIPDLLDADPRLAVDVGELCAGLDFAFAGGGCLDTLEHALDHVPLAATNWNPDCYAADLFVQDFVETCMQVNLKGWQAPINQAFLVRLLSNPPAAEGIRTFRRDILAELADDAPLRRRFADLYQSLCRFRACFDNLTVESRYESTRRRIDTLTLLRDIIVLAGSGFGDSTTGLKRIDDFACEATAGEGYQRLGELLDYEDDLAKVDVRVQVGADGRVRKFDLVQVTENDQNRFYASPLGRWLTKLVLWWRGYSFSNDELVERWLDLVFQGVTHFIPPLMQLLGHMELYLANLAFGDQCADKGLKVSFAELDQTDGRLVQGLFNPLLFKQGVVPVPCTIDLRSFDTIGIITGPNSGGKTRLLQALGLTQLLAQGGLFVPAERARLRVASGMFVSLIDKPRADQKEGRLGSELIRIRRLFETCRSGALVILDELCSGTNPSEGEEIFYLVLTLLRELQPEAFITTHFLEFARRLSDDAEALGLAFLQVELDDHQRPNFGFVSGVAETSLAAQTAARLGVTREELMALVSRNKG